MTESMPRRGEPQLELSAAALAAVGLGDPAGLDPDFLADLLTSPQARRAARLTGTVLGVKDLRAGEGVSYGFIHRATADTRIALVTGGYAEGIVRALGGRADVLVCGARRPIVGRVAMDVCVVDVGELAVGRGDEVVFFGDPEADEPDVEEWARVTGMTVAEILHTVVTRAERVIV